MDAQKLHSIRHECATLKDGSPHPSRPQIPVVVGQETWSRIHALFRELLASANSNIDLDIDPLAAVWSDALTDLCMFVRNAAAMDQSNQAAANSADIVSDIISTIRVTLRCEMTYPEAKKCGAAAGQALSNMATNNKPLQRQLMESEIRDCKSPIESIYLYLLASTNSKTNMAGLMLILNTIKDDDSLSKLLCTTETGQMLAGRVGEMFGESNDDEADEKTMLYVILEEIIQRGHLTLLLTTDPALEAYGLLNALAVYCNENPGSLVCSQIFDMSLLTAIARILTKCHDLLQNVWKSADDTELGDVGMDDIMAAHRSLASTVSILGTITTDIEQQLAVRVLDSGIIQQVIALLGLLSQNLPRIEKASTASTLPETESGLIKRLFMFKCSLIQIIGNISHNNTAAQNLIRELHGLALVLDHMRIDDNHPFIKEYAVVALRSLLENNPTSQAYVSDMEAKGVVQDPKLASAGIQASLDSSGHISVKREASTNTFNVKENSGT
ncbi:Ataxin-10 [Coemansia sp. RSA 1807]|nr:Ataxin-10 [Coemansia sp. RSA 1807]